MPPCGGIKYTVGCVVNSTKSVVLCIKEVALRILLATRIQMSHFANP